jgi:hypothetical protein
MFTHDMTGNVSETAQKESVSGMEIYARLIYSLHCEADVDQEITTATGNEKRRSRGKEDSDLRAGQSKKKKKKKLVQFFFGIGGWDGN